MVLIQLIDNNNISYKPRPASGKLDQTTQNKIHPTASNIQKAEIINQAKKLDTSNKSITLYTSYI
jgi:hypothetical protein